MKSPNALSIDSFAKANTFRLHVSSMTLAIALALSTAQAFADESIPDLDSNSRGPFCSATAQSLYSACNADASESNLVTAAQCINYTDPQQWSLCRSANQTEYREARAKCTAQRSARREVCEDLGEAAYDPEIDPDDFVDPNLIGTTIKPNPYLILVPGYTRVYDSVDEIITVTVTDATVDILGVTCRVVTDRVVDKKTGELVEDTVDWLAQDVDGNVWYFGELVQNFVDGEIANLDGSFKAGENRAKPGILHKFKPQLEDIYREEWALKEAEDLAEVESLTATASSPAASCNRTCLLTSNFTPIEPGVEERKYYVPGIGLIFEIHVEDPSNTTRLTSYHY